MVWQPGGKEDNQPVVDVREGHRVRQPVEAQRAQDKAAVGSGGRGSHKTAILASQGGAGREGSLPAL